MNGWFDRHIRPYKGYNSLDNESDEPKTDHDYYGPQSGISAWRCGECDCWGFYITLDGTFCWDCHKEQVF